MFCRVGASLVAIALLIGGTAAAQPAKTPDLSAIRGALAGTWQSLDDTKFTREFDPDGQSADRYEGDTSATTRGRWTIFPGSAPPRGLGRRDLQPNAVYLLLDENGDQLVFALAGISRSELKMIYMERGNLLSFTRLK